MKILGFVIIIMGLIMVWVGITGDQHNLMAVITGQSSAVPSGQEINPSGSQGNSTSTTAASNLPPGSVSNL